MADTTGASGDETARVSILLADDDLLFLEGMASLLARCDDFHIVARAADTDSAIRLAVALAPDVVLMDISMPHCGGVEATRRLLEQRPQQAVCMLTLSEQEADLFDAVRAGARGYLLKTIPLDDLCDAIRVLAGGGAAVTPRLATRLLNEFVRLPAAGRPLNESSPRLTPREREVLELVIEGCTNPEIAARLSIATNTVKIHLRNILEKLRLRNRQQLAAYAIQARLLPSAHEP